MGEQGVRSDMSSHWNMMDHGALKDHPALKLIDVLAERDAAILERNTALAEKKTANAERDAALLQRDVAYSEWNNVLKERDAAIAALEMIRADRYRHASANAGGNSAAAASKLLQMMNMAVNFPLLDTDSPMPRFGVGPATATPSPLDTKPPPSPLPLKAEKLETETGQKTTPKKRKAVSDEMKPPSAKKKKKPPKEAVSQELMMIPKPESNLDVSKVPIPYCSCTGAQQQCYRWGSDGGWQSACCTNYISTYPLPMNPMKRGSRVPGRKMSGGAFKKLLARIAEEGGDITLPLDLKSHWAKHGTNRYITVK